MCFKNIKKHERIIQCSRNKSFSCINAQVLWVRWTIESQLPPKYKISSIIHLNLIIHSSASIVLIMIPIISIFPHQNVNSPWVVTLTWFVCLFAVCLFCVYLSLVPRSVVDTWQVFKKPFGEQINVRIIISFSLIYSLALVLLCKATRICLLLQFYIVESGQHVVLWLLYLILSSAIARLPRSFPDFLNGMLLRTLTKLGIF